MDVEAPDPAGTSLETLESDLIMHLCVAFLLAAAVLVTNAAESSDLEPAVVLTAYQSSLKAT